MQNRNNNDNKEVSYMPTALVMKNLEKSLNKPSDFEQEQDTIIENLSELINSGNMEVIEETRMKILAQMQAAGILDENGEFTAYYKD